MVKGIGVCMKGPEWYDKKFQLQRYKEHYSNSVYYNLWAHVLSLISPVEPILELGCGTGQFAHYAIDKGYNYLYGTDFSPVAIQTCIDRIGCGYNDKFLVNDVITTTGGKNWTVVCLEVLEHIEWEKDQDGREKDVEVCKKYEENHFIFSVPDFNSESHVRHFPTLRSVIDRYGFLNITQVIPVRIKKNTIWLVEVN